jgi:hypothetical protein
LDTDDLRNRFTYHAPGADQPERYTKVRSHGMALALVIDELCPDSREKSLAITKLDEAIMWANAAIARNE